MIIRALPVLTSLLAPIAAAAPTSAQEFLPTAQAVQLLADGRPWTAVNAEGRRARVTFKSDGTGAFEGPVNMAIGWSVKGHDICLDLRFAGVRCLRFRQVAGGLQGFQGQTADLRLSR
jgi:hypothetical protein